MPDVTSLERKLEALEDRYEEVNTLLTNPEVTSDAALLQRYGRESSGLGEVVATYRALKDVRRERAETELMLRDGLDDDMRALAREELERLRGREEDLLDQVRV